MRGRRTIAAALTTAGLLAACSTPLGHLAPDPTSTEPALPAPPDRRWVGMNDVVVAVPSDWGTETQPCATPHGDIVHFLGPASMVMDCATIPTSGVSSLTVTAASQGVLSLGRRVDIGAVVHGVRLSHSGGSCSRADDECRLTFVVHSADVAFRVVHEGADDDAFVWTVLRSVRRLPDGLATVPFFDYGTSVEEAEELVAAAGLDPEVASFEGPAYATGTQPPAGTVVEEGTDVTITVGDG